MTSDPTTRRLVHILQRLPANVPVCATTATANDRVVADVVAHLGPCVEVQRGPLVRNGLRLQTVTLPGDAAKLAWLAYWLPRMLGTGIVYALTVHWTERIACWLRSRGVNALEYSAKLLGRSSLSAGRAAAQQSDQSPGRHDGPGNGLRQARPGFRDSLPSAGFGGSLLPASRSSGTLTVSGLRSYARGRRRPGHHQFLHRTGVPPGGTRRRHSGGGEAIRATV